MDLTHPHLWTSSSLDKWPALPAATDGETDPAKIWKTTISIALEAEQPYIPEPTQFHTWKDLVRATVTSPHGAAASDACQTADAAA